MSLVAVMLFDFQDRKFLPRKRQGKEEVIQEVRDVENFLIRYSILKIYTKRLKIKEESLTDIGKYKLMRLIVLFNVFAVVCVACRFKTKLAASLARCRVKHNLSSIEYILPESVRKKQKMSANLPLYAWVNTLKCRWAGLTQHIQITHSF